MMDSLKAELHSRLCAPLDVSGVPMGYAISTGFIMPDGDPLVFYASETDDGWVLQDDGTTLPDAIAKGIDINSDHRETLIRGILDQEGARYDVGEYTIFTDPIPEERFGAAALSFISGLIRMQDLFLLSKENARSTFADDVRMELQKNEHNAVFIDSDIVSGSENPDALIRDRQTGNIRARVFAAGSDLRMMEAVIAHQDAHSDDSPIVAVVDRRKGGVTEKRLNFATNKGLALAAYDSRSGSWVERVYDVANRNRAA